MLGVPSFAKVTWIQRLAGMPAVHHAIRLLRVQAIAAKALSFRPVLRKLPKTGVEYRVRFLESFVMADEIFQREIYREAFEGLEVSTYIDLGSNVGYFPCYAAEYLGRRDLTALIVDANGAMAEESRWHVEHNGMQNARVIHGVVGFPSDVTEATFYVNASNVASSAQPVLNPNVPAKGPSKPVTVPTVDLAKAWRAHAGDRRVNLVKIDVEGFEREVLRTMGDVLDITDGVVIEWHKWINSHDEVEAILLARGFERRKVISEDPHCGVAVYRRRPS